MKNLQTHLAEGYAHHQAGALGEAARCYRRALKADPLSFDALYLSGMVATQQGQAAAAVDLLDRAARRRPGDIHCAYALAVAAIGAGRPAAALAAAGRAAALAPERADVWNALATAGGALGWAGAGPAAWRACLLAPRAVPLWFNRARLGDGRDARAWRQVLALAPESADGWIGLAGATGAAPDLARAVVLDPASAARRGAAAAVARGACRFEAAAHHAAAALVLDPAAAAGLLDYAAARRECADATGSAVWGTRALAVAPDAPFARMHVAADAFLGGDLGRGFALFEARLQTEPPRPEVRQTAIRPWTGEILNGRTLLVLSEQGFGDAIQFMRFLPDVAARTRRTIVEVRAPLVPLAQGLGVEIIAAGARPLTPAELPRADRITYLMSLAAMLKRGANDLGPTGRYLAAPAERRERWAARLPTDDPRPLVGFAWAGNPVHPRDRLRSIAVDLIRPLIDLPGIRPVILQMGQGAGVLPDGAFDLGGEIVDFGDSAAILERLDLLVTVDSALAHLGGALGVPTAVLLPAVPDWRWGWQGARSVWYDSLTLYRQARRGDWAAPIGAVADRIVGLKLNSIQK